jgi:hypothetical protein
MSSNGYKRESPDGKSSLIECQLGRFIKTGNEDVIELKARVTVETLVDQGPDPFIETIMAMISKETEEKEKTDDVNHETLDTVKALKVVELPVPEQINEEEKFDDANETVLEPVEQIDPEKKKKLFDALKTINTEKVSPGQNSQSNTTNDNDSSVKDDDFYDDFDHVPEAVTDFFN